MKIKVAAIQTETYDDKRKNIERVLEFMDMVSQEGVKLCCFHSYLTTEMPQQGQTKEDILALAERIPGATTDEFSKKAREYGMFLVPGSMIELDEDGLYETSVLINPKGEIIGKHRKVHPENTAVKQETGLGIIPGEDFSVFDTEIGKIGIMTDLDGYVPAVSEILSLKGAEIICWPLNWSVKVANYFSAFSLCNAIISNCHMICANRVGLRKNSPVGDMLFSGQSRVVDPEGNIIGSTRDFHEGAAIAIIDTDYIRNFRKNVVRDVNPLRRRPEKYHLLTDKNAYYKMYHIQDS